MSLKNFVVKNGLTVGSANIDAATGNLNTGNANLGNLATANFFNGVFTSGASSQPNITSVGTLTGLTVSGVSNLGPNGNVIITGGSSGQFLQTNGSGNLSWTTIVTSGVSNGTSNIDIPVANGNVNTSVGGVANVFVVTSTGANVTGTFNSSGNANVGNLGTAGVITATGTVTGGNLSTGGTLSVTGNANVGNLGTAGILTATGTVTGGNLSTGGTLSVTGNANVGNLGTAGTVIASTFESNVANGTAPIVVASTTKVANLNADLLDGYNTDTATSANTVVVRNADGNISGNNISGTLSTAAQPNITSVGTLTSLDVTGNITTSANVVTDLIVGKTTGISIAAAGTNQNVTLKPTGTGFIDVFGAKISNVATPVASTDAATKGYVDAATEGLHIHAPSVAATPDTLANISGGAITYNNGSSGVGATLTTAGSYTTIDGVNIATIGTRILVKNEANAAHNGIYTYTSSTVLTRATDFDTPTEMGGGDFTFVQQGTLYNDTGWVMTDPVTTVGTSAVNWVQFSGAGTYTAGTGLTLNGTQFSITNTAVTAGTYGNGDAVATFTVNAQGQLTNASNTFITANAANLSGTTLSATVVNSSLTSVGTLGSLAVSGNASAGNISATGDVSGATLTGSLTTASQPNITSVGSLSSLTVTGTATAGNLSTGGTLSVTGNANVGNLGTGGIITATGTVTGGNLSTGGTLSVTGNANVGNIGAGVGVFTGNISALNANLGNLALANFFQGDGGLLTNVSASGTMANGTSNVTIPVASGNVNTSVGGQANVFVVTSTGANVTGTFNSSGNATVANLAGGNLVSANFITGTLTTAAQPNITSVGVLTGLDVNGNITAANITANTGVFTGNGSGLSQLAGGNVTGQVANALVAGTVYTNAQPNITSVGSLTSLTLAANGNITMSGVESTLSGANLLSATYLTGTLTTAAQPNITSVGTLSSLTTSGNVTVGGNVKVQVGITSNRANVSVPGTNTATVIDEFAPSDWRTAKYVISSSGADGYQSVEALLIHDGTDAYITIYGSICSNNTADIINLTSNINGVSGNVTVYAASNSASCVVNLVSSYIKT